MDHGIIIIVGIGVIPVWVIDHIVSFFLGCVLLEVCFYNNNVRVM